MKIILTLRIGLQLWLHRFFSQYCDKAPVWAFLHFLNKHYAMNYKTKDGRTFTANSPTDLVEQLRADSKTESIDMNAFMVDMSRRCYMDTGANIRTHSPTLFVEDLTAGEFLFLV